MGSFRLSMGIVAGVEGMAHALTLIYTELIYFISNMKTILTETFSIIKVSLFWALALPMAAIIFPVAAGWERLCSMISRDPIISRSFTSQQLRPAPR